MLRTSGVALEEGCRIGDYLIAFEPSFSIDGPCFRSHAVLALRAGFEDECAFAKCRDLNPFAAATLAKLAIHIDLGSPWNILCRDLSLRVRRSFGLGFGGTSAGRL
jgi:hypothetical protein